MANIKYWKGGETGDEGNWNTAANWDPTGVPVDTDIAIFDGRSGGQAVDEGLNQTTIDLGGIYTLLSYTGQIGTESHPLSIEVSGPIVLRGTGDCYFMCAGDDVSPSDIDAEIERVIIDVPSSTKVDICSASNDTVYSSVFSLVQVIGGQVNVRGASGASTSPGKDAAGTIITELLLTPIRQGLSNPFVNIAEDCVRHNNSDSKMNVTINGGQLITASDYSFMDNSGGKISKIVV